MYVLQVTEPVDDRSYEPVVLRRLLRKDPTGTLYVGGVPRGANSTVFHRLKGLARTVEYAHTGSRVSHSGGWNAYVFGVLDAFDVPYGMKAGRRCLSVLAAVDPAWTAGDSARIEADLLLRYRGLFGDNPPANLSTGSIGDVTACVRAATTTAAALPPVAWHL